jgi:hypothetical protein
MTFKQIRKGSRRLKAKRQRRPQWVDSVPKNPYAKDTYKIAADNERAFSRAFLKAVRNLMPAKMPKEFKAAFNSGSIKKTTESLDLFNSSSHKQTDVQEDFTKSINRAYRKIIFQSGTESMKQTNKDFGTKLVFTVEPIPEKLQKDQEGITPEIELSEGREAAREAARGLIVPVNPYSINWMKNRSSSLIVNITKQQRDIVRDILGTSFKRGLRAETAYKEIEETVGLTHREFKAVQNRRLKLLAAEIPESKVETQVGRYKKELLAKRGQRIARTETISAQAQGRSDAWKMAEDSGELKGVEKEWVTAPPTDNPDRPCEICLALDGTRIPINGTYVTIEGDEITGPPSHPACRCSETLKRAGAAPTPKTPPKKVRKSKCTCGSC